jgi:fluoride exporter
MTMILSIAAGGALGAVLRYVFNAQIMAMWGGAFPMGILVVNAVGCLAMGLAAGALSHMGSTEFRAFLTTGVLGGFTTFSAFAYDAAYLTETGRPEMAALYVGASVALALAGVFAGLWLGRWATA